MPIDISKLPPPPPPASAGESERNGAEAKQQKLASLPPPPVDVSHLPPPVDPEYQSVRKIIDRDFFDAPGIDSETMTDREIEAIARHHGVDPGVVKDMSTYAGAIREEGKRNTKQEIESSLGRGVGFNIPQFAAKKSLDDPKLRAAFDDLQDLADSKRSFARGLAENVVPTGAIAKVFMKGAQTAGKQGLKQAVKRGAAEGVGMGATAGLARSREGEELESTVTGAVIGGGLGVAAPVAGAGVGKVLTKSGAGEAEAKIAQKIAPEIDRGTDEILSARKDSDSDILNVISGKTELDDQTAKRIVAEQVDGERLLNPETDAGKILSEYYPEGSESLERQLAARVVQDRAVEFARELNSGNAVNSVEDAQKIISEYMQRQGGEEALSNAYSTFSRGRAAEEYIRQNAIRETRGNNFVDRTLNFVSDAQFVLRDISERYGINLEGVHQKLNKAVTRMSFPRNEFRQKIAKIFNDNRGIDAELTEGGKVYNALDTGDISALNPDEMKAYTQFKDFFSSGLDYVNRLVREKDKSINPLSIPARENYIPHMLKGTEDLVGEFDSRMRAALDDATKILGRRIDDIAKLNDREFAQLAESSQPLREVIGGIQLLDVKPVKNAQELSARYKDTFLTRTGRIKLETVARAALERDGVIPDWMREKNLYLLADKWGSNTLRHLYLRNSMNEMRSIARRVRAAGGDMEADYIERLIQDINGIRPGTAAAATFEGSLAFQRKMDALLEKTNDPGKRAAINMAKAIPEVFSDMSKQIYPNLLGMSPRALIMNSTQLFAKTWPELGAYGTLAIPRGMVNAFLNLKPMLKRLRDSGYQPDEFIPKYRQAVSEGIRRSSIYALPSNVVSAAGDAAMKAYTFLDKLNRIVAMGTADQMAYDLVRGSNLAQASLKKMPTALQREVVKAGGDTQRIAALISQHLNASTQYNYNRASMSEFGRTMGPLFSVFSKWPTATAGEIIAEYRKRGLIGGTNRNAMKFIAPLAAFQLFDTIFLNEGFSPYSEDRDEKSDVQKKLFGVSGLSQSAPIGSVKAIAQGDFFTPPAVDAAVKVIAGALKDEGDGAKLMKGVDSAIQNFTPGSVWIRLLTDDVLTLATGERPEGDTFVDRALEGARQMGD